MSPKNQWLLRLLMSVVDLLWLAFTGYQRGWIG
jgi:hypothetical protein